MSKVFAGSLMLAAVSLAPFSSRAGVFISVNIAPPALPVYAQPVCPGPDYIWTPGYWQWDPDVADYYWVPGTWVMAPQPGYLWTPGYWGYENAVYVFHAGYWGPHIGFYGGVNYGFGYTGAGFVGGYWNGPHFFYNTAITNVNVNIVHNTYVHNVTVINNVHTSYNGGPGGLQARPNPGQEAALRENHMAATSAQMNQAHFASQDRSQFSNANHGVPPAAAMSRPAQSAQAIRADSHPATAAGGRFQPVNPAFSGQRGVAANGSPQAFQQNNRNHPAAENRQPSNQSTPQVRPQETNRQPAYQTRPTPQAHSAPQPHEPSHGEERR